MSGLTTPGPWRTFEGRVFGGDGYEVCDTPNLRIAEFHFREGGARGHWGTTPGAYIEPRDGESEANAALIAAAPDLFAACEQAAQQFEFYVVQHAAKGTPDGDAKAATNRAFANKLRHALSRAQGGS